MTVKPTSASPADSMPQYRADEDHDGKTAAETSAEFMVHAEPEQPDADAESGSGKLDMGGGTGAAGGDGRKHNSA